MPTRTAAVMTIGEDDGGGGCGTAEVDGVWRAFEAECVLILARMKPESSEREQEKSKTSVSQEET